MVFGTVMIWRGRGLNLGAHGFNATFNSGSREGERREGLIEKQPNDHYI
jgi:hypothetical protein